VVLEGGAGLGSVSWGWVQPRIAQTTRVLAYDRADIPAGTRAGRLGAKPLIVLGAGQTLAQDPVFMDLHRELARLSTNGVHRVVEGASHGAMVLEAQYADASAAAIEDVVHQVREAQELSVH